MKHDTEVIWREIREANKDPKDPASRWPLKCNKLYYYYDEENMKSNFKIVSFEKFKKNHSISDLIESILTMENYWSLDLRDKKLTVRRYVESDNGLVLEPIDISFSLYNNGRIFFEIETISKQKEQIKELYKALRSLKLDKLEISRSIKAYTDKIWIDELDKLRAMMDLFSPEDLDLMLCEAYVSYASQVKKL